MVLLDEATASLDPENETLIQRAVGTLCAGKTVIVIAHRLRTVANADKIVVLDSGRVAEEGTTRRCSPKTGCTRGCGGSSRKSRRGPFPPTGAMPPMSRRADERMGGRESSEDYLEAILVIRRLRGSCRNVDIAERMGVAKPSVTKALGNLARRGLAEVVGRDVRLTEEGGRLAEATLDKHRFFERLLVESGVDAETASAEACRMEHCLSEDSYRRFAAYLGSRRDEGDGG